MVASLSKVLCSLVVLDKDGEPTKKNGKISTRHELVIGRDANRCQWVFQDPHMSQQHLRIYVVVPQEDRPELEPLIYAEDISRNGVYWNGSLIGNKSNAFLLSDGDRLRLTSKTSLRFEAATSSDMQHFSVVQEREMRVFCTEYVITDRLLNMTTHSRKFMAIEQRSRSQVVCEVITLDNPTRMSRSSASAKRPRPVDDLEVQHEVQAVKAWASNKNFKIPNGKKLEKCFRISKMLQSISHPNLSSLEKILVTDNTIYVFQELIPAGDLVTYMSSKKGRLLSIEAAVATRQVLHAIQALHEHCIVHRNIRPNTILVSSLSATPRFVLSGFELARTILPGKQSPGGRGISNVSDSTASRYVSPSESCSGTEDLRSLGATVAFLLTGSDRLYHGSRVPPAIGELGFHEDVLPSLPSFRSLSSESIDFIKRLSAKTSHPILSAKEALNHEWFSAVTQNAAVQQICEKAVRQWKPPLPQDPFIDFVKGVSHDAEDYACSQKITQENRPPRGQYREKPVEPPYKPFYRDVYHMANAGDRAARTPRQRGSSKLRELDATWKRGMSSSSSPVRSPSAINKGSVSAHSEFRTGHRSENTITLRPKLVKQLSFSQPKPNINSSQPRVEHLSEALHHGDTVSRSVSSSPTAAKNSGESKVSSTVAGTDTAFVTPKRSAAQVKQNDQLGQRQRSPVQTPTSTWALNVHSQSRLNARTSSGTRKSPATPKPKDRRSMFEVEDENRGRRTFSDSPCSTRNDAVRDSFSQSGVTPHLTHLRLA